VAHVEAVAGWIREEIQAVKLWPVSTFGCTIQIALLPLALPVPLDLLRSVSRPALDRWFGLGLNLRNVIT
jgi:hypothetical protein